MPFRESVSLQGPVQGLFEPTGAGRGLKVLVQIIRVPSISVANDPK
jgi:hypothetical protein